MSNQTARGHMSYFYDDERNTQALMITFIHGHQ